MMKPLSRGLAALGLFVPTAVLAAPKDPSGVWLTEDGRARIRVEKCLTRSDRVCGYVVWLKTPLNDQGQPRIDFKNTDPKKRNRPSLGHQLIMGLKPNADDHYEGQIYNSEDGKNYDVAIWVDDPSELTVRGCLLGFLCGSQTWKKTADVAPGQLTGPTNGAGGPRADAEWTPKPPAPKPSAAAPAGTPSAARPEPSAKP
ncbi:conserved hypothetical proteinn [Methylobacterium sp. 4-46]|uniref:DUF2147 domain-containing protein n=1 Tax=unclassified Methylobacterium TaxID=2615210 RepID=UPI000152C0B9|nr:MULTISPECIES: DUF2147 domain-containing protein [Methylobacterium]ACA19274.1 conserved hypothetical proteinn [Methylobacterium sp. 4-46]WFT78479.1 DUF2147 domain-containing protein [Methylobacterium nodulans]